MGNGSTPFPEIHFGSGAGGSTTDSINPVRPAPTSPGVADPKTGRVSPSAKLRLWHRAGGTITTGKATSADKTAVQLLADLDELLKTTRSNDKFKSGEYRTPSLMLADGSAVQFASDDALRAYLERSAAPLASAQQVDALYREVVGRGADAGGVKAAQDALAASSSPQGGSLSEVRAGLASSPEAASAVSGLYRTVLGREASATEVAGFQNTLARGGSLQDVRSILAYSPESRADIGALYRGVLGRAADEGGLAGFQHAVARGESLGEVRRDLAASPETTARVGDVYRQVLGRDVDAGSLADARDALARGGSLSDVRASVARSAEGQAAAADLYRRALGREASAGEVAGVQDALAKGASLEEVRRGVAGSAEARAGVSGVFEAVLGRAPEGTGWIEDALARGESVSGLRAGLAYSNEAAGAIRGLYLQTLGRDADAQGVAHWQGRLVGGMSLAEVRAALAASPEAAARATAAPSPVAPGGVAGSGSTAVQQAGGYAAGFGQGVADAIGNAAQGVWDTVQAVVRLFDDGAFRRQVAEGAARLARLDAEITAYVLNDPLGAARDVAEGVQSLYDRFQAARAQAAQNGTLAEFDSRFAGRVLTEGALAFLPLGTVSKVGQGVELSRGAELAEVAGRLVTRSEGAAGLLQAERLGVSDALSGREGYYFRYKAGEELPEIVRTSGDVGPQLALRPDGTGGYEVVEVSGKVVQATTTALPDGVASSVTRTGYDDFLLSQERTGWNDALRSRTEQMAGRLPDESVDSPAYKAREQAIREASNTVGEIGGASYVRGQFPGAELAYGGPGGAGSKVGDFDQIWRQTLPDGGVRFIVVEAKGGTASLGSALIGDARYSQGTAEYFDRTAANMVNKPETYGEQGAAIAQQLLDARESKRVVDGGRMRDAEIVYIKTQTPIEPAGLGGNNVQTAPVTKAQRFDLEGGLSNE